MRAAALLLAACAAPPPPTPPPPVCGGCHAEATDDWERSQHAAAGQIGGRLPTPPGGPRPVIGRVGVDPLQQVLVAGEGGRLQVYDPAYDAWQSSWFPVNGRPLSRGDGGHWQSGAMTWNSQCAPCHMTNLKVNYDAQTDRFATTWTEAGVGCVACHRAEHTGPLPTAATCAPCHTVGQALDEDAQSRAPRLVDSPGLFYADGSAADEVFEGSSFALSAMGAAGITCLDCHDPHSGKLRATVQDDALCNGCHALPTQRGAPPIDPSHSHHRPESSGARCVACHMPTRTYMVKDHRRDHRFSIPDPALSAQIGAPDACTDCHRDWSQSTAGAHLTAWGRPPRADRERTLAIAALPDPAAVAALVDRLAAEPNAAWRASLLGLLAPFAADPAVAAALTAHRDDPDPLARAAAVSALGRLPAARPALEALRGDPARIVARAAQWATRATLPAEEAGPVEAWLAGQADTPAGQLRLAEWYIARGAPAAAVTQARRAVRADDSGPSYFTLARALQAAGQTEAAQAAAAAARPRLRDDPASGPPPR